MSGGDGLLSDLQEGRRKFLTLVADLRPALHRYCARMTGSIADGEDVVQDTLARAYYALSELEVVPTLRPWLFQIAHRRSLDHLRRYDRRMGEALDDLPDTAFDLAPDPADAVARDEATRFAISRFVELPPVQRSAVILKDVLGHSLDEIAELLELSVPAVKAALHRGRQRLLQLRNAVADVEFAPPLPSPEIARYAALFNARDWDGVRAMLSEDVRLDLVSRSRRAGRRDVARYFSNYDRFSDWHLVPAWLEGREIIAVFRDLRDERPGYFVQLEFISGAIESIRDFRYVPYIGDEARIAIAAAMPIVRGA
jgi:RNA polymerase sigma factor (sigma-70 family)